MSVEPKAVGSSIPFGRTIHDLIGMALLPNLCHHSHYMRLCGVYFPYNSEGKGIKKGILKSYMLAMVFSEFDFKHKNIHPETIYTYFVSE